jgi:hypothetical protein
MDMTDADHALIDRLLAWLHSDSGRHWRSSHPLPPPITAELLAVEEGRLGFALPPLLRAIYLRVGNGGFGPGYGLIGVADGHSVHDQSLVDLYLDLIHSEPPQPWPRAYLTICDWGCNTTSLLKWTEADAPIFLFDGKMYDLDRPWETAMTAEAPSLAAWFDQWLNTVTSAHAP